jgi:ferredoxin-NADP reductase
VTSPAAGQRLRWQTARLVEDHAESATARTLVFATTAWPGHLAGQHVDLRLTAQDGYTAQRSYSLASASADQRLELTVQHVLDGEVSGYLVDDMLVGDELELRGPIGGWFAWHPEDTAPVLLVAGGSGIVPLMAMLRERRRLGRTARFRLVYSVRGPQDAFYADELRSLDGVVVTMIYTRTAPAGEPRPPGRVTVGDLTDLAWSDGHTPRTYVCGPTSFVEAVSDMLVGLGYPPETIRTERFGPTGG